VGGRGWLGVGVAIAILGAFAGPAGAATPPRATAGVLDLRQWQPEADGILRLDGEWRRFPRRLLSPGDAELAGPATDVALLPGTFTASDHAPGRLEGHGLATYALTVLLPAEPPPLALRIVSVSTAYRLWADGVPVAAAGAVAENAADARPEYRPRIVQLPRSSDPRLELVLQVSNFDYVRGGPWEPIWIGTPHAVDAARESRIALALFLAGAFGVIGLYHVIRWTARRSDPSFLYFAGVCFGMALRGLVVDEVYLIDLAPAMSWATLVRLEYASLLIVVAASAMFLAELFPGDQPKALTYGYTGASLAGLVAVAVLPPAVFSRGLAALQLLCVSAAVAGSLLVARSLARRREGAGLFLFGLIAIAVTGTHDVLISIYRSLPTGHWLVDSIYLQPFGLFVFVLSQSAMLARRSSRAFVQLEATTRDLATAHAALDAHARELERRVAERTAELETANRQLARLAEIDGLTGVGNRLHFEEELRRAWFDHLRRGAPLALILADVDEFKRYNDRYGHLAGDEALRRVAAALAASAQRPGDVVARYGGEELVVLLPNTDAEGARQLAERMRDRVAAEAIVHESSSVARHVTLSAGLASIVPTEDADRVTLIARADRALYRAKQEGRDRVVAGD
jgi:diguanylate cyclase (GGDEF)-like protein